MRTWYCFLLFNLSVIWAAAPVMAQDSWTLVLIDSTLRVRMPYGPEKNMVDSVGIIELTTGVSDAKYVALALDVTRMPGYQPGQTLSPAILKSKVYRKMLTQWSKRYGWGKNAPKLLSEATSATKMFRDQVTGLPYELAVFQGFDKHVGSSTMTVVLGVCMPVTMYTFACTVYLPVENSPLRDCRRYFGSIHFAPRHTTPILKRI